MDRRRLLRTIGMGSLMAVSAPALVELDASRAGLITGPNAGDYMRDMGAGMYWDESTASQLSTWSFQPTLIQCAVGTLGLEGLSGPFAMLMYSVSVDNYDVNRTTGTLVASGRMRSITLTGMLLEENVEHDYVAVATDHRGLRSDRFDVHFVTPFWNPDNVMATPSQRHPGWVRFGGDVAESLNGTPLGGVTVAGP